MLVDRKTHKKMINMVLCIIAAIVFSVLGIFSAKYRLLAKEALKCVFKMITLKPCDTGLDDRLKAQIVSELLKLSPQAARIVNKYFVIFSWILVILTFASFAYMIYGAYNFYYFGNCDGPNATGACILNTITGDYGRFSSPRDLIGPNTTLGITAGNSSAKIIVTEFGCFTCPYTKNAEPLVQDLIKKYGNEIYYVFKPFPLPNHKNSFDVAKAVLCANKQGKQWELRNKVFEKQEACVSDGKIAIKDIAANTTLNMTIFNQCFDNGVTEKELNGYISEGKDAKIYATPTFFVNGKPLVGPKTFDEIEKMIKEAGG